MVWVYWPGRDVATLLHEGSKGEPETVEDPKLIGGLVARQTVSALLGLLGVPLVRAEAADQEEHHAHADVGEHNAHPDLVGQRVQEGEDTRFGLLGFLIMMEMPKLMKGFEKSMTSSRTSVIVNGATAISAF